MEEKIKILVADDQRLFRKGLISLLKEEKQFLIVGEASDGEEMLASLKFELADVVLLDYEMPVMDGHEALKIIKQKFPSVKVIILSMHYSDELIAEFFDKGASAYLPKEIQVEDLFEAIRTVNSDGHYLDEKTFHALIRGVRKNSLLAFNDHSLTEREIEVLKQICLGKTNKEIGLLLKISYRTVEFHRENLYKKTKSANPIALAVFAINNGIISADKKFPH